MLRLKNPEYPNIKLSFECREDPTSFTKTAYGDFCKTCQKDVLDLTEQTRKEIHEILSKDSDVCIKIYENQQVTRHTGFNSFRTFAFTSLIALATASAEDATGQTNTPHPTEQAYSDTATTMYDHPVKLASVEMPNDSTAINNSTQKPSQKTELYLTWKFPFIKRRPKRIMMGCPAF